MYLKRIEVQGFKSFANKLTFEFQQGITGIVGPNGSGKSNVADAVRWVLGEQSAKQLRGGNMQDVIFAGTELRRPQSFASVAITFDNSDHALDISYEEVTVTRRLYRSGESEYMINNTAVRLRDINELFYDTGIGKEGYSIIGQGQIERIISGKPEERRELFDEAAGIVKFKRRKAATIKKLNEEQQNLVRVSDILTELTAQLGPLKRQSETAKIYLDKRDRLRDLDINLFLIDEERIEDQVRELTGKAEETDREIEETRAVFEETKTEYERVEQAIETIDGQIADTQSSLSENSLTQQRLSNQIELLEERIRQADESAADFERRRGLLTAEIERHEEELAGIRQQESDLAARQAEAEAEEKKQSEALSRLDQAIEEIRGGISDTQSEVIKALQDRSAVKGRMTRYDAMLEQIGIRQSEISARLLRFHEEESGAREEIDAAKETLRKLRDEIEALTRENADREARVSALTEEITRANHDMDAGQTAYHREASRLESLKAITEHYEGYGNGIKKVMEQKGRNPGILGVVADLISTDEKYETAMETALGGSLRNIVTDNESTAKYLIEFLKNGRFGRATFLPLTNIKARRDFDRADVLREEGVIGVASSLARCEDRYKALCSHLLGRTIVVDNIDHAIRIGRKYNHTLYMVTLAGESFAPGGSITGGAFRNQENLLGRRREIEELSANVRLLKKEMEAQQAAIEEKRSERTALRNEIVSLGGQLHAKRIAENTAEMSRKQAEERVRINHLDRSALEKEAQEIRMQIDRIHESQEKINTELAASEAQEAELNAHTEELEGCLASLSAEREKTQQQLSEVHLSTVSCRQQRDFALSNMERCRSEIEARKNEISENEARLREGSQEADQKRVDIETIRGTIEEARKEAERLSELSENQKKERAALAERQKTFFARRDELSEHMGLLDKESYRLHSQIDRIRESRESQVAYLWDEYELTPSQARGRRNPEMTNRADIRKEISTIKDEIKKLGHVNVNAIEDYKNVLERHTFLSAQHTDLVESEKTLTGIIDELDRGMRKQFSEKFKEIAANFNKTFRELFGGGTGSLEIDPNLDVLEAGIAIIAQPPGKKLQNIMQLSGGEKSLTAIALLFAIQNMKPSPFALLDEIEAALDDNNVARFAAYLHKLTKHTQFIVITHRRGSMAAADRLYGITMQEKGVSTLVSVSLIEDKLTQ